MVKRNSNFAQLQASYLFLSIEKRKNEFAARNPDRSIISLGIGDTTEPLGRVVTEGFRQKIAQLETREGYSGYPPHNGTAELRAAIAREFYGGRVSADEVFISDGSKPDLSRFQFLLPTDAKIAVQDPVYPAYVDGAVMTGKAGTYNSELKNYSAVTYLPCNEENGYFPSLDVAKDADVIYFCSPNNPTGAVASREQLTQLVTFAKKHNSLIIFDAAYQAFIGEKSDLPRSIYEIPGAKDVAIETGSFSKILGFTGVRLGWCVCPKDLKFDDGTSVHTDLTRVFSTFFNGPSNIAEAGALASLSPEGLKEMRLNVEYYMNNARNIRSTMQAAGFICHGGVNSPYVWVKVPGKDSWTTWEDLFEHTAVVTTPGLGFGSQGQEFIRLSAFAHHEHVTEALERIKAYYASSTSA